MHGHVGVLRRLPFRRSCHSRPWPRRQADSRQSSQTVCQVADEFQQREGSDRTDVPRAVYELLLAQLNSNRVEAVSCRSVLIRWLREIMIVRLPDEYGDFRI